jgi:hypothetical protein
VRLDASELIRRAEREVAVGSRSAAKTLDRARQVLLRQRDTEGLKHLLELAERVDKPANLTNMIHQNLRLIEAHDKPPAPKSERGRPRRVRVLLGVLLLHGFGALTWLAFLGVSSDSGTDRQFHEALRFGAATWLVAALLIAWLWWSGRWPLAFLTPFAWWFPSFLLMIAVVYGW